MKCNNEDYKKIVESYSRNKSIEKTVGETHFSKGKVRKTLITEGLWTSKQTEIIQSYITKKYRVEKIAEKLDQSTKNVYTYIPYTEKEMNLDGRKYPSSAKRVNRYRNSIKYAYDNQVTEKWYQENIGGLEIAKEISSSEETYKFDTVESCGEFDVLCISLKLLSSRILDDKEKRILRKWGKVNEEIERQILIPSDMTLHGLSYLIQAAFGWNNTTGHFFQFPEKIFNLITSKNIEDKDHERIFGTWIELAGRYFRPFGYSYDALCWDDDYDGSQSIKEWLKTKYRGPYRYRVGEEYFSVCKNSMDKVLQMPGMFVDMPLDETKLLTGEFPEDLIERNKICDLLFNSQICFSDQEILANIEKAKESIGERPKVYPVSDKLIYFYGCYDWKVEIEILNMYKKDNEKSKYFDYLSNEIEEELINKLDTVYYKRHPVCIKADGLSLPREDLVENMEEYIEKLEELEYELSDERQEIINELLEFGWNRRKVHPSRLV